MTRSIAAIIYPRLAAEDLAWIQRIRDRYDVRRRQMIDPHFTLVFPDATVDESTLLTHVRKVVQSTPTFDFVLRCAILGEDKFSNETPVFLIPDEGNSQIVKLHDLMYTGVLRPSLRLNIAYLPHIGIGNLADPAQSKQLVDELNAQSFEIRGQADAVDVIWVANGQVGTVEKMPLSAR